MFEDFGDFGDELFLNHCMDDYLMDVNFAESDKREELDELWEEVWGEDLDEVEDEAMCRGLDNAFEGRTDIGWD